MTLKTHALNFIESLETMELKHRNMTAYADSINKYLEYLNAGSIDLNVQVFMDSLSKHIDWVRSKEEPNSEAYKETLDPDYCLMPVEWAIDSTIKEHRYSRWKTPPTLKTDLNLAAEISNISSALSHDDAMNFIGELAGAWILTYPIVSILKYDFLTSPKDWAQDEIDYIYILRRLFDIEFGEWRR